MKLNLCIVLTALASFSSAHAVPQLSLLTVTEQNESLSVTWNGSPLIGVSIQPLSLPVEAWHVTLPSGFILNPGSYTVGEPAGETGINVITVDLTFDESEEEDLILPFSSGFIWSSDLPGSAVPNVLDVPIGGVFVGPQAGPAPFGLRLEDLPTSAPDAGSTFALAGLGLFAIGALRSRFVK
jgi:hypothetical protein